MPGKRSRKKRTISHKPTQQNHQEHASLQHQLDEFLEHEVEFRRTHDHGEEGADERLHDFMEHLDDEHSGQTQPGSHSKHIPDKQPEHVVPGALPLHEQARVVHADKYLIGGTLLLGVVLAAAVFGVDDQGEGIPLEVAPIQAGKPGVAAKIETEMASAQMLVKPELKSESAQPLLHEHDKADQVDQPLSLEVEKPAKKAISSMIRVTANLANVRSEPHTGGKVLYRLEKGTEVRKVAVIGGWYRIRLWNGTEAWAHETVFK